jgi:hypothetical protein
MTDRVSLTLIVPEIARELANTAPAPAAPQLAHLAARGSLRYAWDRSDLAHGALYAWQRGLLWALQLAMPDHPGAALTALANDLAHDPAAEGDWLHADPVHLVAGLNHLSLVELGGEMQLTLDHRAHLEVAIREHVQGCGWQLHGLPDGRWLIQVPRRLQLDSVTPSAAAANELEHAMPQGTDAAALRRLMTELQMLLHEHPVNRQRAQQGLPAANSIWLWGNGRATPGPQLLPRAFGADAYLSGIYRLHAASVQPAPASSAALLAESSGCIRAVVVLDAQPASRFEQQWLVPLVQALRAGRLGRLDLVLDSWHLSIDRRGLLRFWRRPLPPASWVA